MFDDLKPDDVPAPPARALEEAVRRGTGIRRRRRAAWASGVTAVVVLVVAVVLGNPFSGSDTATVVPATATPAAPKDYSPIPLNPTEKKDKVSFGFLQKVTQNTDGSLTLRIQPGYYLSGQDAIDANGGQVPMDDYLSDVKKGTSPTDVRLDPRATLRGSLELSQQELENPTVDVPITSAELLKNFRAAGLEQIGVWYRLAGDGSITALSEQFTP